MTVFFFNNIIGLCVRRIVREKKYVISKFEQTYNMIMI